MDWFRLYHNLPDTGPWLSLTDTQRAIYIEVLCLASRRQGDERGTISADQLHRKLRRNAAQVLAACSVLTREGLLVKRGSVLEVQHWHDFQYSSDSSAERTRKYRERKKTDPGRDVTETSPEPSLKRHGDALEQRRVETEQNREDTDTPRVCAREAPSPRIPRGTNDAVIAVVEAWRLAWDCPDYRHGLNDTIAINDALADRWTVEQLCASVTGWVLDPWSGRKRNNSIRKLLEEPQKGLDLGKKQKAAAAALDWGSLND